MTKEPLMTLDNGDLYRPGAAAHVVRERYKFQHRNISGTLELRATLRAGSHTSLGGYPLFLLTSDGECLHFQCARDEYRQISTSIQQGLNDGWRVIACDVNYEDTEMVCAHCGKPIESAYGEDSAVEE